MVKAKDITDEMVVAAYAEAKALTSPTFADWLLEIKTGAPAKVVYRAMERSCKRGLIDYGVSLRSGWLTDAGKFLLESTRHG